MICGVKQLLPKTCSISDSVLDVGPPPAPGCARGGSWTVPRCISNVSGYPPRKTHGRPRRCAPDVSPFLDANEMLTESAGLPPGSRVAETLDTPKHSSPSGCHHRFPPARFRLDVGRKHDGTQWEQPKHRQSKSRMYPFYFVAQRAYPPSVIRCRRRPQLPSLLQHNPWRPQWSA